MTRPSSQLASIGDPRQVREPVKIRVEGVYLAEPIPPHHDVRDRVIEADAQSSRETASTTRFPLSASDRKMSSEALASRLPSSTFAISERCTAEVIAASLAFTLEAIFFASSFSLLSESESTRLGFL